MIKQSPHRLVRKAASIISLTMIMWLTNCTNLDENLKDALTPNNFPKTEEEFTAALLAPYANLYNNYFHNGYFTLSEFSSDEMLVPTRGSNWYDGGQPVALHTHFQTPSAVQPDGFDAVIYTWENAYGGITACNRLIATPGISQKPTAVAELKVLRAWYYYYLMDLYGNIPLATKLGECLGQKPAAEIYTFIEDELISNIPLLTPEKNYGRITYWAGKALQVKLYLNHKVYLGSESSDIYQKAIDAAQEIIDSNLFSLEANYFDIFSTTNNNSSEHIWAVPFDFAVVQGFGLALLTLHYAMGPKYNMASIVAANGYCTSEEFYNSYDPTDSRKAINFIAGPQFAIDGVTPIIDGGAEANDPDGPPLNLTPHINDIQNALSQEGARIGKYEIPVGVTHTWSMDNDFPVFRLGAVLLDQAEAIMRKSNDFSDPTAVSLINQLMPRAGLAPYSGTTSDDLLAERGRELFAEAWRRNDLIRFGKYGDLWFGKLGPDAADGHLNIFPIPITQIIATAGTPCELKQNPGY